PPCGSAPIRRYVAIQGILPNRKIAPSVPVRGFQPDKYGELQSSGKRDRHGVGRQGHEHFQQSAATAGCLEVSVLKMKEVRMVLNRMIVACLLLGVCAPVMRAQIRSATILGTVVDPAGSVIAGADVVVTNLETNISFKTRTTDAGQF